MTKVNPTSQNNWGLSLRMVSKLISIEKPKVLIMVAHFVKHGFTWITQSHKFFSHSLQRLEPATGPEIPNLRLKMRQSKAQ